MSYQKKIDPKLYRLGIILLIFIILLQIILITVSSYTKFYQNINSDSASDLLQAELASSQGHWLFADNWYNSTELRVFGVNVIPSILFNFGLSYRLIWALTCGIGAILITLSVLVAMRMLHVAYFESLLACLLILLPTWALSHFLYVYPAYQMFLIHFILFFAFAIKLVSCKKSHWIVYLLGITVSFICGLCGLRLIIQGMVPLVIYQVYRVIVSYSEDKLGVELLKKIAIDSRNIFLLVVSMALGYFVYSQLLCWKYGSGHASLIITSVQGFSENIMHLPEALLMLYGLPYKPESIGASYAFIVQICFIVLSYVCYYWLVKSRDQLDTTKRTAVQVTTALVLFNFFLLCLLEYQEGGLIWRYWGLGAFPMMMIIPLAISNWKRNSFCYSIAIIVCLLTFVYPTFRGFVDIKSEMNKEYVAPAYLNYLAEKDFEFGEATFWNANLNTILSDGEIRIKPVFNDEQLSFYMWLTHKDYEDRKVEFILLTNEEYKLREENKWDTPGEIVFNDGSYLVFQIVIPESAS